MLLPCRPGPRPGPGADRGCPSDGIPLGDILADSGYAHRDAEAWAIPLRQAGAQLVQDLHPSDRGPRGTHDGAIIANGNLYCPVTPRLLLELGPLARDATPAETAAHDTRSAELARYKLGKITADDTDGYHRVMCPAVMGKIRCPLRPASMTLDRQRPEILTPPEHPPDCCAQQTLTVPPDVAAKTRQKHDYPSAAHRRSYARRTGAERTFSTAKDPASNNIARGWCRLTGLAPLMLWLACLLAVRNQRILDRLERPPGTTTPAAPRPACRPAPAAGAARPSPTWPPQAPRHDTAGEPRTAYQITAAQAHQTSRPCPEQPARHAAIAKTAHSGHLHGMSDPNVKISPGQT